MATSLSDTTKLGNGFKAVINYEEGGENAECELDYNTEAFTYSVDIGRYGKRGVDPVEFKEIVWPKLKDQGWKLYPINAYIHSGVAFSTGKGYPFNDQWDSGLAGLVAVNPAMFGEDASLDDIVSGAVRELGQWWNGEVYWVDVIGPDDEPIGEYACGGFIGYESAQEYVNELKNTLGAISASYEEANREAFYKALGV